jgi:hypothetical protein
VRIQVTSTGQTEKQTSKLMALAEEFHFSAKLPHRSEMRQSLFSEHPKEKTQDRADQQAGHQREVEAEVPFGVVNVSGQSSQPALAESRPDEQADSGDHQAKNKQHFTQIVHDSTDKISLSFAFSSLTRRRLGTNPPRCGRFGRRWARSTTLPYGAMSSDIHHPFYLPFLNPVAKLAHPVWQR